MASTENPEYGLESIKLERDRFVAFAFSSADILVELDAQQNISFIDGATNGFLGLKPSEMRGKSIYDYLNGADLELAKKVFGNTSGLTRIDGIKLSFVGKDLKRTTFAISGYQLPYIEDHFFLTLSHIKANVAEQDLIKRDLQTGLLNREAFTWEANKKILEAKARGENLQMSMIDLSGIANIIGDLPSDKFENLLEDICKYLKSVSIGGDLASIFDNGHFGVIHSDSINSHTIREGIEQIARSQLDSKQNISLRSESVTMDPLGINDHDAANAVLYTINKFANDTGDDFTITSLTDSYRLMLEETLKKMKEFKKTIFSNAFQVAFQPIMMMGTNNIHHYETLVRLDDSVSSFSSPFGFISFGEQAGIINEFDLAMCQKVIDMLNAMSLEGKKPGVSINVSGKSLSSRLFREALKAILEANQDIRSQIIFEITESARIEKPEEVNEFLQELRKEGHQCCLDDFGAGQTSFDYIRLLEVDYVKIDGSYVTTCIDTERGKHLLKAIITVCHEMGMQTVAEMIETKEVADFLGKSGVSLGQGYLYGKPTTDVKTLKPTSHHINVVKTPKNQRIIHETAPVQAQSAMKAKKFSNPAKKWWAKG